MRQMSGKKRQSGAVLIVAMVFLLLLTLLAVSSMKLGILEALMASNEQSRVEAFQYSQGLADGMLKNWKTNFVTDKKLCSAGHPDTANCDSTVITMEANIDSAVVGAITEYSTEYLGETSAPYSSVKGTDVDVPVFIFRMEASYDNTANRQGKSEVTQGVQIYNPAAKGAASNPDGDIDKYVHIPGD